MPARSALKWLNATRLVDGVQHELDAEQNADGVAPRHDAEKTDRENCRREYQVGLQPHQSSGLAK
jgi:hypothetical protein